jgi:hypothetical protein
VERLVGGSVVITGTFASPQTLQSMTATAPSAGVMVVRACGSVTTGHVNATSESLTVQIHEDEGGVVTPSAPSGDQLVTPRDAPTADIQHRFCVEGHFPVTAGPKTFYLRVYKSTSGEFWSLQRSYISALFVASVLP